MAANRYGRIYHDSDYHYNNLRFPSVAARREFAEKFEKFHAQYEHDGEPPRYEDITASTIGNMEANRVHDVGDVSIDGYMAYEIYEYHNDGNRERHHYRPPTTIAPPVIVVERQGEFIDSSTLTRHELSAICLDMPDEDFQSLLKSVEENGFKDPLIRMIGTEVLDGWHRYRAAKELNLLRKLRFQQWNEEAEGDPVVFAYAKNQARRHQSQSIRAQIAVRFHERFGYIFGHGGDRASHHDGDLKTRQEIAKGAGVSTTTLDRARQVEKAGRGDEVMAGESAAKIIEEENIKSLWEQIHPAISEWKKARDGVGHASKSMFIKATLRWEGLPSHTVANVKVLKELLYLLTTTETNVLEELVRKQLDGKSLWADPEEELAEKRKLALEAEQRMFNALDEVAPDWDYDDFIAAACDKHDWGVIEFPDLDYTDIPDVWEERYNLLHSEITKRAPWIQEMLDRMAEPTEPEQQQETEQPKQTAEEREANKLLKEKTEVIKLIWDRRIEAGRDYLGDGDSDLNLHLTLADLEKGFAKHEGHTYCVDAFRSAMQRTSETSFNICLEKTLSSDVSLEALELEYRAMSTYRTDISGWQRQEWIQQLIEKKKAKAAADATEPEPDKEGLSKEFKRLFTLHTHLDRDVVDCEALGGTYHIHVDDVERMMDDFQRELGALEHAVRKQLESDAEMSVADIASRVKVDDIQVVETMIAKIQIDETKRPEPEPEVDMDKLWDAFNKRLPKWKAKYAESGYKENDLVQNATEAELFDALRSYRHSDRTGPVTAEEIQDVTDLMKRQSYPYARHLRNLLRDRHKKALSDVDRCYAENQLCVVQNVISPLLERLGADDMFHVDKENLTADLYDVFLKYENVPTEKEMIIALLDVIDGILSEDIPETLDNEVLCPDDENDRQMMNSDLVTSVA